MNAALRYASPTVFRVSYGRPDVLPPWKFVGGGRFDDPQQTYRVLYTSLTAAGACIEKFQDFRPNDEMASFEAEFEFDESAGDLVIEVPSGTLLFDRYAVLLLGRLSLPQDAELLDLTVDTNARLFSEVLRRELTVADLVADRDYALSGQISRFGYTDGRGLAGIYNASKIDPVETQNVTLYEGDGEKLRISIHADHVESLSPDMTPFAEACSALGIRIESAEEYRARTMRRMGP